MNRQKTKKNRFLAMWILLAALSSMQIIHGQSTSSDILKVKISGNGFSDETFILFKENASNDYEADKDAWKLFSLNPNVPMIYTTIDGAPVSINTFPLLENNMDVDLFTKIKTAGFYTIETKIISPFSDYTGIYIMDEVSMDVHSIADSVFSTYLSADSGQYPRFSLYFSTQSKVSATGLSCFKNMDGKILIENLSALGWNITVTDENMVFDKTYSGLTEHLEINNLPPGTYAVEINNNYEPSEFFSVSVSTPLPVLSVFETSTDTVYLFENQAVNFTSISPEADRFAWDFGDGYESNEQFPSHTYTSSGDYFVSLIVSDSACADTSFRQIFVRENFILDSDAPVHQQNNVIIYFSGDAYIINTAFDAPQDFSMDIFNLTGQKIFSIDRKNIKSETFHFDSTRMPLLFSIKGNEGYMSKLIY